MSNEKRVKDLMSPVNAFPSVYPEATLSQALAAINSSTDVKFALVVERGDITGVIGAEEIMEAVRPRGLKNNYYRGWNLSRWSAPAYMEGLFTELCRAAATKKVSELMKPAGPPLRPGDTLSKAVDFCSNDPNGWAPVIDKDQVVGIVSFKEVLTEIQAVLAVESRKGKTDLRDGFEAVNA